MPTYDFSFPASAAGLPVSITENGVEVDTTTAGSPSTSWGAVVVSAVLPEGDYVGEAADTRTFYSARTPGVLNVLGSITSSLGNYMYSLFIEDDLDVARPEGHSGPVEWITTIADPDLPTNFASGDKLTVVEVAATAATVWSDTFTNAGVIGSTETGAIAWTVAGTGYVAARASGHQVFTAGTSSIGVAIVAASAQVDSDETVTFTTTIVTKGVNNQAGIILNYQDSANYFALVRTSGASGVYRLVRRVATVNSTYTTTGATWPTMTDGDVIQIIIVKSSGLTTFTINGSTCWSGVLSDYTASIGNFGHYCGASASFAEMAYDNSSMTTLAA